MPVDEGHRFGAERVGEITLERRGIVAAPDRETSIVKEQYLILESVALFVAEQFHSRGSCQRKIREAIVIEITYGTTKASRVIRKTNLGSDIGELVFTVIS